MKKATVFVAATCGLLSISSAIAQNTVFSDNFQNGSTVNGTSTPGGTPTASSTSYDIAASKASSSSVSGSGLAVGLTASTTSGFWEAQAVFSSTPVTLATVGDYINLTYTFTDTGGLLFSTNSAIYSGLYDSAGATPVAGGLASSGLSATAGSGFATGNAATWSGYVGRFLAGAGTQQLYSRPVQNGTGTSSANQDLIGNNFGGGAYNNPTGTTGGNAPSTLVLTSGNQYTISYLLTLSAANQLTISENFFSGITATGIALGGATNTFSSVTDLNFSGLAIGARNSGVSANPQMTVNQITITDFLQPVPEPSTIALAGIGVGLTLLARFRRR
jgi:hypothetical protein